MAAVGGFNQVGPFQFQPPKEFSGKREDFEKFVFKLKSYLCLINPKNLIHLQALQDRERELTAADFQDVQGQEDNELVQMATHLQWLLVTLCNGVASTFLRRETTEKRLRVLQETMSTLHGSIKGKIRWTAFEDLETRLQYERIRGHLQLLGRRDH